MRIGLVGEHRWMDVLLWCHDTHFVFLPAMHNVVKFFIQVKLAVVIDGGWIIPDKSGLTIDSLEGLLWRIFAFPMATVFKLLLCLCLIKIGKFLFETEMVDWIDKDAAYSFGLNYIHTCMALLSGLCHKASLWEYKYEIHWMFSRIWHKRKYFSYCNRVWLIIVF